MNIENTIRSAGTRPLRDMARLLVDAGLGCNYDAPGSGRTLMVVWGKRRWHVETLIVDWSTWRTVARPSTSGPSRVHASPCMLMDSAEIDGPVELAYDGTLVHVYWADQWRIATAHAPDVSDLARHGVRWTDAAMAALTAVGARPVMEWPHDTTYTCLLTNRRMHCTGVDSIRLVAVSSGEIDAVAAELGLLTVERVSTAPTTAGAVRAAVSDGWGAIATRGGVRMFVPGALARAAERLVYNRAHIDGCSARAHALTTAALALAPDALYDLLWPECNDVADARATISRVVDAASTAATAADAEMPLVDYLRAHVPNASADELRVAACAPPMFALWCRLFSGITDPVPTA